MHYLIDTDSLIYKAGCSNETRWWDAYYQDLPVCTKQYKKEVVDYLTEQEIPLDDVEFVPGKEAGPLSHSISNLKIAIERLLSAVSVRDYTLFVGGSGNFRNQLTDTYKATRDPLGKPIHYEELRHYLIKQGAVIVNNEEVDDRISWWQCQAAPETTVITSIDKDLNNTPGWHYNYDKQVEYLVTPAEADWNFWRQMITGDVTDNIPGLPRAGKKAADKYLPEPLPYSDMEHIVWEMYQNKELTLDYFTLQGRLLWMRRQPNEMWEPDEDIS